MIKKSTLIVLAGAIVLGAAFYYLDWKRGEKKEGEIADTSKAVFSIPAAADISSITISHPAKPDQPTIQLVRRDGVWRIAQPMDTDADQKVAERISTGLAGARATEHEPGTPDRLKVFGLDPAVVVVEFQLKDGAKHTLKLGNQDFSGASVYALPDSAKEVALLSNSILANTDLNFADFRNHAVLPVALPDVASINLKNSSGELAVSKDKSDWKFSKPAGQLADEALITGLISGVANARWTAVASENPDNLAKYGLAAPSITYTATDSKGKTFTLLVGKKENADYFARDTSRPMIFRIGEDLHKKLSQNFEELRDKRLAHFDPRDVMRFEFHNANGILTANRKGDKGDEWTVEAPADLKGKSATAWKLFTPLTSARADDVLDHPSMEILAQLAKPTVEADLSMKDGKKFTVLISKATGDFVYGRENDAPAVYKLKKQILDELDFKPSDFAF